VQQPEVIVLGAGIIGLSAALHLQARGREVALIDRGAPGDGTSFGNAGLIERSSIYPYAFPRRISELFSYALNSRTEARYDPRFVLRLAPWLARYWWHSAPDRHRRAMQAALPLIENSLSEHEPLVAAAGAEHLLNRSGWIKLFHDNAKLDAAMLEARKLEAFGVTSDILDPASLRALEPHLSDKVLGGVHYRDPVAIRDPKALSQAYFDLFIQRGGAFHEADARSLANEGSGWGISLGTAKLRARDAVVALGPWSDMVTRALGYAIPLAVKRGYHAHYKPAGNAVLNHAVLDAEAGYVLAPMQAGIRLTTGAEFAARDAAQTPIQLAQVEPAARRLFPLAERIEPKPWMGARPCTPDMLPVIGPAPRHKGLWFCFGHAHHGLTLGPVSGRLLAQMMVGEAPFTDPTPYGAQRFAA
jgi:D-amino-acid dehydrogenase